MLDSPDPATLTALYDNRARVPDFPRHLAGWAERSAAARSEGPVIEGLAYGPGPGDRLDWFPPLQPATTPAPVLVFLHGGWWRALSRREFSFVAPPFQRAGVLVVVPDYDLCPAVGIDDIVRQMARMLEAVRTRAPAHGADPGRLAIAGHSAGGHLAATLMHTAAEADGLGAIGEPARRVVSISGVHDLAPFVRVPFLRDDLRLTPDLARRLSPVARPSPVGGRLIAVSGADETPAFGAHNAALRTAWGEAAVPVCESLPGRHHFDILDDLVDPAARLHRWVLEALQ